MFSRAVLPLLRQRSLTASSRFAFTPSSMRMYARARKGNDYPLPETAQRPGWQAQDQAQKPSQYASDTPLRPVEASPNETINPQASERASTIPNPVAAPEISKAAFTSSAPKPDNDPFSINAKTSPTSSPRTKPSVTHVTENEPELEQQPSQTLPDLTKGIPSTLAAELGQAQKNQAPEGDKMNITEDPESPPPGPGGRGGGELPKSAYVSSSDRRRSTAMRVVYLGLTLGISSYLLYLGRNWDTEEEAQQHKDAPAGYSPGAMYNRMRARLGHTVSYYSDPVAAKLLPDQSEDPNQRPPFVLVLSLEDMLIHSEWSRQNGYRIAKRPGLDYFIRYLHQYYELVLFTSQPVSIGEQVWKKLDPFGLLYPLFREHTLYADGGYIKDLSYLNRDPKKIVIMDTDAHHVKNQPENAILLPKWNGDPNDQTLIQFIPFLEYLAMMGFDDARTVLKSFEGKNIPVEFARREKLLREKFEKDQGKKSKSGIGMGSLFGAKKQTQSGLGAGQGGSGNMIWDQIREQGQKNYESFNQRIQEEGPKWLAEQEALDKIAQEEAMQSMKSGMFGWFGSSSPQSSSPSK